MAAKKQNKDQEVPNVEETEEKNESYYKKEITVREFFQEINMKEALWESRAKLLLKLRLEDKMKRGELLERFSIRSSQRPNG